MPANIRARVNPVARIYIQLASILHGAFGGNILIVEFHGTTLP